MECTNINYLKKTFVPANDNSPKMVLLHYFIIHVNLFWHHTVDENTAPVVAQGSYNNIIETFPRQIKNQSTHPKARQNLHSSIGDIVTPNWRESFFSYQI